MPEFPLSAGRKINYILFNTRINEIFAMEKLHSAFLAITCDGQNVPSEELYLGTNFSPDES